MRLVFMGAPGFAVTSLEHLVRNNYDVAAVYTQPDRPAGRGQAMVATPVKGAAQHLGLPVVAVADMKSKEEVSRLAALHPDVIVVAAFGQMLPPEVLKIAPYGCVNIHPSLLPRHRGASPVAGTILSGDEFGGVSIMLLDTGMDTGPVLIRARVTLSALDSTGSYTEKLSLVAARLLQETLTSWVRQEIVPQPQDESAATYTEKINKEDGEIDWCLPAVEIWRRVRAYNPWPGSYTRWHGKKLKILKAFPVAPGGQYVVGQVMALPDHEARAGIGTGDGVLEVRQVQLEGKRAMPAVEFLRGQRDFIGASLPG